MTVSTRSLWALSTGAVLALATVTPATAAPTQSREFVSKVVRFKDLDIATATGAEALYERIVSAARSVCREETHAFFVGCRTRAVDDAVKGVGSPLLTSIHRSMTEKVEEVVNR
jgi:UrcA family protein